MIKSNQRAMCIVGLALFLVLLATACVAGPTSTPTPMVSSTLTTASTPLQELVGRLFSFGSARAIWTQITLGSLPADFSFPVPEGTRVVGSVAFGDGSVRMVSLDIPLDPKKTLEFFRDELAQDGWKPQESFDSQLRSYEGGGTAVFCKDEDTSIVLDGGLPKDGVTPVIVMMVIQESLAFQCRAQEWPGWPEKVGAGGVLPALTAPEGSTWGLPPAFLARSAGELNRSESVKADATLSTNLGPQAVEGYLRDQLLSTRWVLEEHGGDGPIAWSTWDVQDEPGGPWDGLLAVVRLPGGESSVSFRLYRAGPELTTTPTPAPVLIPDDKKGLEELLARFFSESGKGRWRILPEALPSGFDIPLPPGARVVGSVMVAEEDSAAEEAQIILDVATDPREVERFFQEELAESGWYRPQSFALRGYVAAEGTLVSSMPFLLFCNDAEDISMQITISPAEDGLSGVRIASSDPSGFLCSRSGRSAPTLSILPTLKVPPGSKIEGSGTGDGGDQANAEVTLLTDLTAVALAEHFGGQLEKFAWVLMEEGADGPSAWSIWKYEDSDGNPWVGLLLAIDLPDGKTSYAILNTVQRGSYQWEGRPTGDPTPAPTPKPGGAGTLSKLVYKMSADDPSIEQIEGTLEIIRRRLRTFGLEGTATSAGGDQLAVELRDVSNLELVKRLIGDTARLEFKERTCSDPRCQEFTDFGTLLNGDDLSRAEASTDQNGIGWVINLQFNGRGAEIFSDLTRRISTPEAQLTKRIAIIMDDQMLLAPVARAWISDGRTQITGNFSREEARTLAVQLESGRLPVALELILEEVQ